MVTRTPTGQPAPSSTATKIKPPPNATLTASLTPDQKPTSTATISETPPPGWIAFNGLGGEYTGLNIIHTSGKGWRNIDYTDFDLYQNASWSPDGQWIAIEDDGEIVIVRPDGSNFINLGDPDENIGQFYPAWLPDSQTILYTQTEKHPIVIVGIAGDLYTTNINTKTKQRLTYNPVLLRAYAAWSPHGDMIAYIGYSQNHIGDNPVLWVMNSDGSNPRSLTPNDMNMQRLVWSPDGNAIILSAINFAEGYKCQDLLYQVNLDGSGLKNLTNKPGNYFYPTISSSGEWLAFGYDECINETVGIVGNQLYVMRIDGQGRRQLWNKPNMRAFDPSWSPIPGLEIGKTFETTELGDNINLRASASLTGAVQLKISKGEKILVLDGFVEADDYLWWHVRVNSNGQEGWVAENPGWFVPVIE